MYTNLTRYSREIEDQSYLGSCAPTAFISAVELITWRAGEAYNLSKLGLYQDALSASHHFGQNIGLDPNIVMKVAMTLGIGDEALEPYVPSWLAIPHGDDYRDNAATQVVTYSHKVALTRAAIEAEVDLGNPVITAFDMPVWLQLDPNGTAHSAVGANWYTSAGGHALPIVGCNAKGPIFEGSYGNGWGDCGFVNISWSDISFSTEPTIADGRLHMNYAAVVDGFGDLDMRHTPERLEVTRLYAALFARAPELDGLNYWSQQLSALGVDSVAQAMFDCAPARAIYPVGGDVVSAFYLNALGRAPDAEGLAYWSGRAVGAGPLIEEMIHAVINYDGVDPIAVASKALFNNRVNIGEYSAISLQSHDASVSLVGVTAVTSFDVFQGFL